MSRRLLEPLAVVNPLADRLPFPAHSPAMRLAHAQYLTLIDALALLHQRQRARMGSDGTGPEAVVVSEADVTVADELARELFALRPTALPPQTAQAFAALQRLAAAPARTGAGSAAPVTRQQVREQLGWTAAQARVHLERLCAAGCLTRRPPQPGRPAEYILTGPPAGESVEP